MIGTDHKKFFVIGVTPLVPDSLVKSLKGDWNQKVSRKYLQNDVELLFFGLVILL